MNTNPLSTRRRAALIRAGLAAASLIVGAGGAAAQAPEGMGNGPVRLTSVFPTGSGPDLVARLVAERLQARWGRPVIVEPTPGGAGMVAINAVKAAAPTGNDLAVVDVGNLSINPLIFSKLSYDPQKDLVPVALLYKTAFFVTVAADGPYRTLRELVAAAGDKANPLRYGSNAVGGPLHLGAARVEDALGAEMQHVPFKETSQLYASVATGEVNWAFGSIATAGPLVRAGKLRFLAVADAQRSPAMPDVPTLAEAGGPRNLDALTWVALVAPRGTPERLVAEINRAVNDALAQPDVRDRLAVFGFAPGAGAPRQVAELMQLDRSRYAEVLKRVKVTID